MANFITKILKRSADGARPVRQVVAGDADVVEAGAEPERVTSAPLSLTLATVYRCVTLISESVANLPLRHERRGGAAFAPVSGGLATLLGVEPNEWTSAFDFWRMAIQARLLYGEAYIVPVRDWRGEVSRLVLATPGTAAPDCTHLGLYHINDDRQGLSGTYSEAEVIRLKGPSLDGVTCQSVIGYAARTMSIAATADRNTLDTFASGGATMGILSNDLSTPGYGEIQGEELQKLADRATRGMQRHARFVVAPGRVSYTPFTVTAADMQFLESRKFTVREICRFFGVHPSFVFDDTSNNYKSAEMANVAFLSNTLNPILRQVENELDRKLLADADGERCRFDRAELYATDLDAKMRYIEKRIQTGTMTVDEARITLGMEPVVCGDAALVSANLKRIDQL